MELVSFIHPHESAMIIDGQAQAALLRNEIRASVATFMAERGYAPGLAVVLVGDNPASQVYVANKEKACIQVGMTSFVHRLPASTTSAELLTLIAQLNGDSTVHGILVQMPLPPHLDSNVILEAINPAKDVDGLHPANLGRLLGGRPGLVPCTPQGCMMLIKSCKRPLKGLRAVVIGRSILVGKPMALLLSAEDVTVTLAHSKTANLPDICREADILVSAVGRPGLITADFVKKGAIVIDVGITRLESTTGGNRLSGDVQFDEVSKVAGFITPVPGGVGPMTIACLLKNTLQAALQF